MLNKMIKMLEKNTAYSVCPYIINKNSASVVLTVKTKKNSFSFELLGLNSDGSDFASKIIHIWKNFDIDERTYKLLNVNGHSAIYKNILEAYNDVAECKRLLLNAVSIVSSKVIAEFGDGAEIVFPSMPIKCSDLTFFDDLEHECWNLIEKYAEAFGIEIKYIDEICPEISFDIAKEIQDHIIDIFERSGVKFDITYFDEFKEKAYELYKKDWCKVRGYNLKDVEVSEAEGEEYNGEMYACFEEFIDNEFNNREYMNSLMSEEYDEYLEFVALSED